MRPTCLFSYRDGTDWGWVLMIASHLMSLGNWEGVLALITGHVNRHVISNYVPSDSRIQMFEPFWDLHATLFLGFISPILGFVIRVGSRIPRASYKYLFRYFSGFLYFALLHLQPFATDCSRTLTSRPSSPEELKPRLRRRKRTTMITLWLSGEHRGGPGIGGRGGSGSTCCHTWGSWHCNGGCQPREIVFDFFLLYILYMNEKLLVLILWALFLVS